MNTHIFVIYHNTVKPDSIFNPKVYGTDSIKEKITFFGVNELYEKNIVNDKGFDLSMPRPSTWTILFSIQF